MQWLVLCCLLFVVSLFGESQCALIGRLSNIVEQQADLQSLHEIQPIQYILADSLKHRIHRRQVETFDTEEITEKSANRNFVRFNLEIEEDSSNVQESGAQQEIPGFKYSLNFPQSPKLLYFDRIRQTARDLGSFALNPLNILGKYQGSSLLG